MAFNPPLVAPAGICSRLPGHLVSAVGATDAAGSSHSAQSSAADGHHPGDRGALQRHPDRDGVWSYAFRKSVSQVSWPADSVQERDQYPTSTGPPRRLGRGRRSGSGRCWGCRSRRDQHLDCRRLLTRVGASAGPAAAALGPRHPPLILQMGTVSLATCWWCSAAGSGLCTPGGSRR